jgi:hypothetical protein
MHLIKVEKKKANGYWRMKKKSKKSGEIPLEMLPCSPQSTFPNRAQNPVLSSWGPFT